MNEKQAEDSLKTMQNNCKHAKELLESMMDIRLECEKIRLESRRKLNESINPAHSAGEIIKEKKYVTFKIPKIGIRDKIDRFFFKYF